MNTISFFKPFKYTFKIADNQLTSAGYTSFDLFQINFLNKMSNLNEDDFYESLIFG
jgi:hypothetical protein